MKFKVNYKADIIKISLNYIFNIIYTCYVLHNKHVYQYYAK